ncbi:MAG: cupin [Variovorax sp.]|nr:cupin [Variovorax sp.]
MGASHIDQMSSTRSDCRLWVDDPAGFSTARVGRLHHDYHLHPLLQLPELEALAKELAPLKQCRFVRPGITQASAFAHDSVPPDGRSIEEVFRRIEEPGSWIALYDVEVIPRYKALLDHVLANVREIIDREQHGMFQVTGFVFISAPPSVTPFHIDRENNFWLMLHGRKVMNVWDRTDRTVVPLDAVEDFIVAHSLRKVKLKDEWRARSHEFDVRAGDGVYFPSTSPHMTRSDPDWTAPGDRVAISIGVNFYTPVTRRTAQVHQLNRVLRKCGLSPRGPGESEALDALKAPFGKMAGLARSTLARVARPILHRGFSYKPPPGSY